MQNENGSGDKTLDNLVVIMAIVLFFGTAQVMSTHAPQLVSDLLGFDASYIFGVISAVCVEWGALRLHFNRYARNNNTAKAVKWILLGMSGLCQVYNAAIETGTMSSLSETLKIGFTWVVPNIPLIFIILMFWIGSLSPVRPKTILEHITETGIYNMLPKMQEILYGKGNTRVSPKVVEQLEEILNEQEQEPNNNGANPTNRRS
jgi:hypothetical protein